jgi:hypothetical protein
MKHFNVLDAISGLKRIGRTALFIVVVVALQERW